MRQVPDHISHLRARPAPMLPAGEMVIGMTPHDAAEFLPRVFNLCRAAQSLAVCAALGLPVSDAAEAELAQDILRDHVVKIALKWPAYLGLPPLALPPAWQSNSQLLRQTLFGPTGQLPSRLDGFDLFLDQGQGIGSVLSHLRQVFMRGEACTGRLPLVTSTSAFALTCQENSVAARQAARPVMAQIENAYGRGPFWRATAIAYDIESCLEGTLPALERPRKGAVAVPAARGIYTVDATLKDGRVTTFRRVTPTDHLLVKDGVLDQSLAKFLGRKDSATAKLLLDILDPCVPVQIEEVSHA